MGKHTFRKGLITALSVDGELDAWQLEFRIYHRGKRKYPHSAIAELMTLPLEYDRVMLKKAVTLMQAYAGTGHRIDLLPLYPLGREIRYWLKKRWSGALTIRPVVYFRMFGRIGRPYVRVSRIRDNIAANFQLLHHAGGDAYVID